MTNRFRVGIWLAIALLALGACGSSEAREQTVGSTAPALPVESSAFKDGAAIPEEYTCDGKDTSPPLSWASPPAGTQSLALIVDDPDAPAGTWVHWVVFNLPATAASLPAGVPADRTIATGGVHGSNSWKQLGYGGPCPPKGSTHRYFFKLYALDSSLDLQAGASKADLEQAIKDHVLAQGQLIGTYSR
jgi:Raf kinase inhibitor-like YbhB/YbcL family protein